MKIDPSMLLGGAIPVIKNLYEAYKDDKAAESEEEKRRRELEAAGKPVMGMKKGGKVKAKSSSSASKRADGCAQRGKTKGRFV